MFGKNFRKSIQYRFLKNISIILFVSTGVLSTSIAINEGRMLKHSLMTKGESFASTIAKLTPDPLIMKDSIQLDSIVNEAKKDEDIIYIIIQDAQGNLITSQYASINYHSQILTATLSGLSKESDLKDIIAAIKKKEPIEELSVPIVTGGDVIGKVTICMSQDNIRKQIVQTILFIIALNLVVTFALGTILFTISNQIIFDPIAELADAAVRLAKGDLSIEVNVPTAGEVQMLVESFNRMARDLKKTTVSKEYVDNVIKSMNDALLIVSPKGDIMHSNASACALLGYEEKELTGQPVGLVLYEELSEKDSMINDISANGSIENIEKIYLARDGKKIPVLFSASAMRDENDRIQGIVCVAQDIRDRKQTEEALRTSEEKSRQAAQENAIMAEIGRIISSTLNIDDVYERFTEELKKLISFDQITINHVNPEDQTFFIAYASGSELAGRRQGDVIPLSGTATKEMIRTRSSMIVHLEDKKEVVARFPGLLPDLASGFRTMMVVLLISKDQVIGVLQIHSLKPNAYTEKDLRLAERVGNQIAGAIANAQLFTERLRAEQKAKSLEEQLRQSQRIEAIGRLAGGIAHDFNNLLTVIKGYSELLLAKLKQGDPLKGNLEEIHRASQRATDLTRQLLAFSRRQILEFKVLDLNIILRDLDKMLHRLISEDIELVYLLSNDLGKVKTDPGQVEQMILNLTVNARDAMPSGGKLTLETANVELDEAYAHAHLGVNPGHYVMLSMSDTGVGMTPEVKEHLFEPFFTTKEKGKGTGLGLSTVYGIVKQSGGDIWVYSEPGQGTTFKIYLPRVEEEESTLPHGDGKGPLPRGRETILLVEDELSVRGLAVQVLRENGYHLLEAANGNEASHMVQEYAGEIHLLLTDVVMPQMGGKELADRIEPLQPDIKVLFTSGYTDNAIVHHGVLDPGVDFIQKPFSPTALLQKVREVLDR